MWAAILVCVVAFFANNKPMGRVFLEVAAKHHSVAAPSELSKGVSVLNLAKKVDCCRTIIDSLSLLLGEVRCYCHRQPEVISWLQHASVCELFFGAMAKRLSERQRCQNSGLAQSDLVRRRLSPVHDLGSNVGPRLSEVHHPPVEVVEVGTQLSFCGLPGDTDGGVCTTHPHQSNLHRASILSEGDEQQDDAKYRNEGRSAGHIGHSLGPNSHFRLGLEIALGAAAFVGSFWFGFQSLKSLVDSREALIDRRKIKGGDWLIYLLPLLFLLGSCALSVAPVAYWLER